MKRKMMVRVFDAQRRLQNAQIRVYRYSDGKDYYSFITHTRTQDVTKEEAEWIIENWGMVDVTEQMKRDGWI